MAVWALIPAAGKSTRMGRPKLTLPLGERTVLEHVAAALRQGGVSNILVVLPPQGHELAAIVEKAGARPMLLTEPTPDMRASIERGLDWLEAQGMGRDDRWLLAPADHPTLEADVVRRLLSTAQGDAQFSIHIPTHGGRRGHPTLIGWKHVAGIRALPRGQGLNAYLRQHADEICEVPVASAEILFDLDTPEDFQRLLIRFANRG